MMTMTRGVWRDEPTTTREMLDAATADACKADTLEIGIDAQATPRLTKEQARAILSVVNYSLSYDRKANELIEGAITTLEAIAAGKLSVAARMDRVIRDLEEDPGETFLDYGEPGRSDIEEAWPTPGAIETLLEDLDEMDGEIPFF